MGTHHSREEHGAPAAGEIARLRAEVAGNRQLIDALTGHMDAMAERLARYQAAWEQIFESGRHYERAAQAAAQFPDRCLRVVARGS